MNPISPELAQRIQLHVDDLQPGVQSWPVRLCKEKLNALPLHGDQINLWALRPDGVLLSLDHESASLPVCEETDPLTRYAVLLRGAQKYPDLQPLVPLRPLGVQQCELCSGTGEVAENEASSTCMRCRGLGWHVILRRLDEWLERIDRGDRLGLQAGGRLLTAGRLAGVYLTRDGKESWSNPTTNPNASVARHRLREQLARFNAGKHVVAEWWENVAEINDPFESINCTFVFHETGPGGSCTIEFTRQQDGEYLKITNLNNDWDPLGSLPATIQTVRLSEMAARAEVVEMMLSQGWPAVVKRN